MPEKQEQAVVSLAACPGYEASRIEPAFLQVLAGIGWDLSQFAGRTVALKPNLLTKSSVEQAIVTHPAVFRAAVRIVKRHGGRPVLIESPAIHPLEAVMRKTGYDAIAREEGCRIADARCTAVVRYEAGRRYRSFEVIRELLDADIVLNLPKFKTHSLTYVTGAVKNLFGLVPGLAKARWHLKTRSRSEFADFLLDLYEVLLNGFVKPKVWLHVVDAVVAMEGEGPGTGGRPRPVGALLAGTDAVAVDAVAVRLVGFDPGRVRTVTAAEERGLGVAAPPRIRLTGAALQDFRVPDFVPPRGADGSDRLPLLTRLLTGSRLKYLFVDRPVPAADRCTLCGQCATVCPAGAIRMPGRGAGAPVYDYGKCVGCLCCLEICPAGAVYVKKGVLQRLLSSRRRGQ